MARLDIYFASYYSHKPDILLSVKSLVRAIVYSGHKLPIQTLSDLHVKLYFCDVG